MKFPEKCPHCGKDIVENSVCETPEKIENLNFGFQAEVHRCIHCNDYIFALRSCFKNKAGITPNPKEIECYLPVTKYVAYPQRVKDFCPEAYEIYLHACNARDIGLDSIVGAGLRMAVEHLVWHYLVDIQNVPKEKLEGKMLGNLIPMLEGTIKNSLYLQILKYFGNKIIHVTDAPNFTPEEAFESFERLLLELDAILLDKVLEAKLNEYDPPKKPANT